MTLPKKDEVWVSKHSELTFRVLDTRKHEVDVEVERRLTDKKTGEVVIEKRQRTVPEDVWPAFSLPYERRK